MVASLLPAHMRPSLAQGTSHHITCVYFARSGDLLATYHEEVRVLCVIPAASALGCTEQSETLWQDLHETRFGALTLGRRADAV